MRRRSVYAEPQPQRNRLVSGPFRRAARLSGALYGLLSACEGVGKGFLLPGPGLSPCVAVGVRGVRIEAGCALDAGRLASASEHRHHRHAVTGQATDSGAVCAVHDEAALTLDEGQVTRHGTRIRGS